MKLKYAFYDTGPQNKLDLHSHTSSNQGKTDDGNIQPGKDSKYA